METVRVLPGGNGNRPRQIAPTDVSQFIRLEQCRQYLRLWLWERVAGQDFMRELGVAPQSVPPILANVS